MRRDSRSVLVRLPVDNAPVERRPEVSVGLGRPDAQARVRHHHRDRVHVGELPLRQLVALAPTDAAADAKALQICCDAVDFITEATKPDFACDRKEKWLTHFAAVTSADAPVNYGDFLLFTALELAISSFTAAVDESELPDGLGKWWNRMLQTKAVAALKGKGKKLMPGEHNKAW